MKEGKAACSLTKNSLAKLKWSNFTARPLIKLLFESSFWFIDGFFQNLNRQLQTNADNWLSKTQLLRAMCILPY